MEPRFDAVPAAAAPRFSAAAKIGVVDVPRPEIDYIVEIRAGEFIAVDKLVKMQHSLPGLMRRISFGGLNYQSKAWEALKNGYQRHRSVEQAKRHLASLSPERQAMLQAEWEQR